MAKNMNRPFSPKELFTTGDVQNSDTRHPQGLGLPSTTYPPAVYHPPGDSYDSSGVPSPPAVAQPFRLSSMTAYDHEQGHWSPLNGVSRSSLNVEAFEQDIAARSFTQRCHFRCTCVECKTERGNQLRRRRVGYVVGIAGLAGVTVMIIWYVWNMVDKARGGKNKRPL